MLQKLSMPNKILKYWPEDNWLASASELYKASLSNWDMYRRKSRGIQDGDEELFVFYVDELKQRTRRKIPRHGQAIHIWIARKDLELEVLRRQLLAGG